MLLFYISEKTRIIESVQNGRIGECPFTSSIKDEPSFPSLKVQEKLKIFFITFERPHYQLFPPEISHRRHHLHLPQSLVLVKYFSSHQHTLR